MLDEAGLVRADLDAIAYTAGPGLVGALMVGAATAHGMARALGIPVLGVHHMEGHLLAPMLEEDRPAFPFVALLVSGGHTQLVEVRGLGSYTLLGESVDDAAGEAFDKAAKMLGLDYPGGPQVARLAERGDPARLRFPRPMTDRPGLDFSFSGLKTHTLTAIRQLEEAGELDDQARADVARAFEEAVVDTLVIKCRRALDQTGLKRLVVAGGVSANARLRERLEHGVRQARRPGLLPPRALLHRQRCDDRLRGRATPAGRRARRDRRDAGGTALANGYAARAVSRKPQAASQNVGIAPMAKDFSYSL